MVKKGVLKLNEPKKKKIASNIRQNMLKYQCNERKKLIIPNLVLLKSPTMSKWSTHVFKGYYVGKAHKYTMYVS